MTDTRDQFQQYEDERRAERLAPARFALGAAQRENPDEAGRNAAVARNYGTTPNVVAADPQAFARRDAEMDAARQLDRAPRLIDWIGASLNNAAMARDDLQTLADVESSIRRARFRANERFENRPRSLPDAVWRAATTGLSSWLAPGAVDQTVEGLAPRNLARSLGAGFVDLAAGVAGVARAGVSTMADYSPVSWAERALFGHSTFDRDAETWEWVQSGISEFADSIAPEGRNTLVRGVQSGVRSIPLSAASLAGGVYTGSARVAAALLGGVVGGMSYGEAREQGLSNEAALAYGTIDAGIEIATEYGPARFLIGNVGVGTPFFRRMLNYTIREVGGEQAATALQDLNAWAMLPENADKTFGDYLAERPGAAAETLIATLVTSGAINVGLRGTELAADRIARRAARAEASEETGRMLDTLRQFSEASRVRERDVGSFEEFVRQAADGTEATDVYVDARELVATFDQSELTPDEITTMTGMSPQELAMAAERGDDVQIPIEQFAARIAPTDIGSSLIQHLRLDPDEMSVAEARVFMQGATDEFAATAAESIAQLEDMDTARASMDAVRESFISQLNEVNRFTPDANAEYATLISAFYATMGSRVGLTAEQMAERYPLEVRSGEVVQPTFDQSGFARSGFTANSLARAVNRSAERELRGIVSPNGEVFWWDASEAIHKDGAERVGVDYMPNGTDNRVSAHVTESGAIQINADRDFWPALMRLAATDRAGVLEIGGDGGNFPASELAALGQPQQDAADTGPLPALENLPARSPGPFEPARQAAYAYMEAVGLPYAPPRKYARVDIERAARIAQAYDEMRHAPNDPRVRAAYDQLVAETLEQWKAIKATGLQVEFAPAEDPYAGNPWGAVRDVRDNNHIYVFSTEEGYGQGGITPEQRAENPMLEVVEGETWSGQPVLVNDVFRVVHDYFGHIKEGVGFRAGGEENAWRSHSAMYSPLARQAMTTETRGQNSWLNYGPRGEANRTARVEDTVFAEQKIGLLPDWAVTEGALDPVEVVRQERNAAWSAQRVTDLIQQSDKGDGTSGAYVAMMTPDEFLGLTLSPEGRTLVEQRVSTLQEYGELDPAKLAGSGPITLVVRPPAESSEWQKSRGITALPAITMGHDGRHRAMMMKLAGVERFPVVVSLQNGRVDAPVEGETLMPQSSRESFSRGDRPLTIERGIPLTAANRAAIERMVMGGETTIMFQDAVFYSALERAIEATKTTRAPAQQWIATLKKAPGVKQEELEWSGILDWLEGPIGQSGPVSRDDLLTLVRNGGIQIEEVVLGDNGDSGLVHVYVEQRTEYVGDDLEEVVYWDLKREDDGEIIETFDTWEDAQETMEVANSEAENAETQFSDWSSDPANETYRELLITLPTAQGNNPERAPGTHWDTEAVVAHARFMEKRDADGKRVLFIEEVQSDWHQAARDEATKRLQRAQDALFAADGRAAPDKADRARVADEIADRLGNRPEAIEYRAAKEWNGFERALSEEELAPILEREGTALQVVIDAANRARPFVIEAMRIVGRSDLEIERMTDAPYFAVSEALSRDVNALPPERLEPALEAMDDLREAELRHAEANVALDNAREQKGIPEAPFKASWPALVMKRMIRWAVDNGYQKVAWTTGDQQNERYSLEKFIDRVTLTFSPGGIGKPYMGPINEQNAATFRAYDKEGREIKRAWVTKPEDMHDLIGPELSERLFNQAPREVGEAGWTLSERALEGVGLSTGGDGMRGFYDRNLVNITNGLIKKYGAKVEPLAIPELQTQTPDAEYQQVFDESMRLANAIRGLSAAGGRERTAQQVADLRAMAPGVENYMEQAAPLYASTADSLESALPLYDELDAVNARLAEMQREGRGRFVMEGAQPGFTITPELAEAAAGGFPLFQRTGAPRGQIAFGADITQTPTVITLLRHADLSTFLHETGHFFLEVMTDIAVRPDAPADVVADLQAVLKENNVDTLKAWTEMSPAQRREVHETFARSFEAYLFEGRAPNLEMKSLFQRFRSWLVNVYRQLANLNVTLTDEVRGVFDRMLASDDAIAEAQADAGLTPMFDTKPDEMTDAEFEAYQRVGLEATQEAAHELEQRSLRDMRYAGRAAARELKRLQREAAERRKAVKAEVTDDLSREPVYRATQYIRTGKIDGEATDGGHRLYTPEVREILKLGDDPMPSALNGMTSTANGVNPEQVAALFGYSSADEMLRDLLFASPLRDAIEAETDARMQERYGELASPEALQNEVQKAIRNDVRGRHVATELAVLNKAPGSARALAQAAKRVAADTIARIRIRNLRPSRFEAAERRAAAEAHRAGTQDLATAATAKRNQLYQFHAARAAREALTEADRARRYLAKFDREGTRRNIDKSYLDQIDVLLERFDLRASVTDAEADRRRTLAEWVESQRQLGFEPALDPAVLDELFRTPFRELTVEETRGLVDSVRNIEHLGRVTKKLMTAKDKADFAAVVDEITDGVRSNAFRVVPEIVGAKTWWEQVRGGTAGYFAWQRKLPNIVHVMDGNKYGGPFWERLIRPMNEAGDKQTRMNAEATERLGAIFAALRGVDTRRREHVPEIGRSLSLEDRIMVALNWGNGTNRARIVDGDGWTEDQVMAILRPLTAEQWNFVEQVWEFVDSYWPQIVAKETRVSGVAPEKVEAEPFQIEIDGQLRLVRGGYFPIKYDPDRSSRAEADTAAEIQQQMQRGLYTRATTRRGHTQHRVDTVRDRPVRKDFGVLFEHTSQVIHDLSWHEWLIDANRLLRAGQIDSAIREHYGPEVLKWMREAVKAIAVGDIPAQNAFESAVNHLRVGTTIAGLGWNLWTSLLQPLGLTQSISRIGVRWVAKGVGDLIGNPSQMNAKIDWIYERSSAMRDRARTLQREINEVRNRVGPRSPFRSLVERAVPEAMVQPVADSYFVMIAKAQLMADLPTWIGQYEKSMAAGETEDRAVAMADQAVIDTQSGGQIKDLAGVQRGGPLMKIWTNFLSYFNATYNLMADRTAQARRIGARDLPYYAIDMAMLTFAPASLAGLMRAALVTGVLWGALDGDDDDQDKLVRALVDENVSYMLGTMIGLREIAPAFSDDPRYSGPAGIRVIGDAISLGQQVQQGEIDEQLWRSANRVAGQLLHYPAGQVDRTIRGFDALAEGEAGPLAPLVGPPPRN